MSRRRHSDEGDAGSQPHKRRRTSEPIEIEDRLESLICRVGEKSTSSLESNLEGLAGVLEADLPNYKGKILRILCAVARLLPEKLTVYTTLVGLLNARNYNFGGEFVEAMIRQLKETLKSNLYSEAIYLVCAQEEDIPQVRSDWYVYAVLSSLPWVGKELYEKKDVEMDRLLNQIEGYLKRRQKTHVSMLQVWTAEKPHPQEEYLDCLWAQVHKLKKDRWQERHILRPYIAFDSVLCEALQHNLPPFTPPAHSDDAVYPMPHVVFRMFDYTDAPEVQVCLLLEKVIFGELFQLPSPPHIDVMYTALLIELCKLQPGSLPQVLAQATEMMYMRLDTMNTTCIDLYFTQLSYHQRIVDIVPPSFSTLIPANPVCSYKYEEETECPLPGLAMATTVSNAIKNRASNEEILIVLKDVPNPNQDDDDDEGDGFNPLKIEVFLQTLLHLAAKSFSHSFSALAKFHEVLKNLTDSDEGKLHILRVLYEFWRNHPQMTSVLVDKLIRTQIVDCAAVANWIFSPEMAHDFTRFYVWEILHSTIRKMNKHVQKIQKELDEAKEKLEKQQNKKQRDSGDEEDMEKNSEDEEGQLEEQIERLQEKVESAQSEQKNLFLVIFQRFIMLLTEHLVRCETSGVDINTTWYKNCIERLQQIFLMHYVIIQQYMGTLENLLFTAELDHHILAVYQQFCALQL
ncbi:nuclear cap-binding protein subunit 1-like [Sinocyclocheilus anshuiensis]|uniref:nuclear cap-binding protein subunit 1-like n=1 Tax=Sinocyclocheilus anshuiensis TaxID=1608454 RepID=UPI0007B8C785|nr:PREDICTED: nuclear cap-binding protein subunit 1-like [Sinocyclocheilus anshuiensis]